MNFTINEPGQPGQQLNVDLSTLKNYRCSNCNNQVFQQLFIAKKVTALQSPSGKEGVVPMQIFACVNCGDTPLEFGGNLIEYDDNESDKNE